MVSSIQKNPTNLIGSPLQKADSDHCSIR